MMNNNYQIFHRRQDIGRRISLLHREEQLAVGMVAQGSSEDIANAIEHYLHNYHWPLTLLMDEEGARNLELQSEFPQVTLMVFHGGISLGTKFNAFANECYATYFLTYRSDQTLLNFDSAQLCQLLQRSDRPAVITPVIVEHDNLIRPSVHQPRLREGMIDPLPLLPTTNLTPNLYPLFGLGYYDRALFQRLRGFDENIFGDYWQFLDFGVRCWLFGYPIYTHPNLALKFTSRYTVVEDRSDHIGTERCLTKALGVQQLKGKNFIKRRGKGIDGKLVRNEVKPRLALYKSDFAQLLANWRKELP